RYDVREAERLCGVGLLKRRGVMTGAEGRRVERFMSTAHVAALPFMSGTGADPSLDAPFRELRRAAREAAEELEDVAPRATGFFGNTDGGILFPQRLAETLVDLGYTPGGEDFERALTAQRRFLDLAGRGEPVPYYAILVADGDGMGQRIQE